jgi:antitoxin (DNA-binding transcriptional repressor) of toxin-antitoxin stability system
MVEMLRGNAGTSDDGVVRRALQGSSIVITGGPVATSIQAGERAQQRKRAQLTERLRAVSKLPRDEARWGREAGEHAAEGKEKASRRRGGCESSSSWF